MKAGLNKSNEDLNHLLGDLNQFASSVPRDFIAQTDGDLFAYSVTHRILTKTSNRRDKRPPTLSE